MELWTLDGSWVVDIFEYVSKDYVSLCAACNLCCITRLKPLWPRVLSELITAETLLKIEIIFCSAKAPIIFTKTIQNIFSFKQNKSTKLQIYCLRWAEKIIELFKILKFWYGNCLIRNMQPLFAIHSQFWPALPRKRAQLYP